MKSSRPYDFGKPLLVEDCRKIRIDDLVRACRAQLKKMALDVEVQQLGLKIDLATSRTRFDGTRFWFSCPLCDRKVGVLFQHPHENKIGCRTCLGLDYAKRRYKGMVEGNVIEQARSSDGKIKT